MSGSNVGLVERAGVAVLLVTLAASGVVWGGATLAALISGGRLGAGIGDAMVAATRLPSTMGEPAAAWSLEQAGALPGPGLYWACTAVALAVGVASVAGLVTVWRRLWRADTDDRDRLGVDARAWLAGPRDLRTLFVSGQVEGRFILGWFGRRLVATECRATTGTLLSAEEHAGGARTVVELVYDCDRVGMPVCIAEVLAEHPAG